MLSARLARDKGVDLLARVLDLSKSGGGTLLFRPRLGFAPSAAGRLLREYPLSVEASKGSTDGALSLIGLTSSGLGLFGDPGVCGMLILKGGDRFHGVRDPVVPTDCRDGLLLIVVEKDGVLPKNGVC